jgi:tetratricopeptide (TPR) repeat protein
VSPNPDRIPWPGVALLAIVLSAGVAALFLGSRPPSQEEESAAIRDLLSKLGRKSAALDAQGFAEGFAPEGVLARIKRDGSIEGVSTPAEEKAFLIAIRQGLTEQVTTREGTGSLWTSVRASRVDVVERGNPLEATADAIIRIALPGGLTPARFWVIKDSGHWKVVDFELLDEGRRLSVHVRRTYEVARKTPLGNLAMAESVRRENLALAKLTAGDAEGALEDSRQLRRMALHPAARKTARTIELIALGQLGRDEEGLEAVDRYIAECPDAPYFHLLRAYVLYALERWADSIAAAERYLGLVKSDPRAFLAIGRSLERMGRAEDAISTLNRGAKEDPDDAENRFHLGRLLLVRGDRAGASAAFNEMVRNWSHDTSFYDRAAKALRDAGGAEQLVLLSQAQKSQTPSYGNLLRDLTWSLRRLGRLDEADATLREALSRGAAVSKKEVTPMLALVTADRGLHGQAEQLLRESKELSPEDQAFLRLYLDASQGRETETLQGLRTFLAEWPERYLSIQEEQVFSPWRDRKEVQLLLKTAREHSQGR